MTPKRIRTFQWIAIVCLFASAGLGGHCAAQSKTSDRSEGESLLLEVERKLLGAKTQLLRIRIAVELPFLITEIPGATGLLRSFSRGHLMSALAQLDTPTVPKHSRGKFKAVVKEKLDGRDALKVEWYTERSVVVAPPSRGGCMYCRPSPVAARMTVVQDNYIVWLDAATKLRLKQVSPNGMVKHYRRIGISPNLDSSRNVQPAGK